MIGLKKGDRVQVTCTAIVIEGGSHCELALVYGYRTMFSSPDGIHLDLRKDNSAHPYKNFRAEVKAMRKSIRKVN